MPGMLLSHFILKITLKEVVLSLSPERLSHHRMLCWRQWLGTTITIPPQVTVSLCLLLWGSGSALHLYESRQLGGDPLAKLMLPEAFRLFQVDLKLPLPVTHATSAKATGWAWNGLK